MNDKKRDCPTPRGAFLSRPGLVSTVSLLLIAGLCLLLWAPWEARGRSRSEPLRLYCAAGIAQPIRELLDDYEKETGVKVEVSYGGSGNLLASIIAADGKGDLYLAADAGHIDKARRLGLADEVIPLGTQRPVVVVNRKTHAELEKAGRPISSLKDLLRRDLRVVIANPEIASIGQLSRDVFKKYGLWKQMQADMALASARVSTVGTVNEVATAVRNGDNTAGIVWVPNAEQSGLAIVPVEELAGLSEPVLLTVLSKTGDPAAALSLARYLQARDRGGRVFGRHSFEPVKDADPWEERPVLRLDAGAMLKPALEPIVRRFEEREGVRIQTRYLGCGVLVSTMRAEGAVLPDAFFACEVSFLDQVKDGFHAGSVIAQNDVVLVVARGKEKEVTELSDLTQGHLRVGLGDPQKSALGALTDRVLRRLKLKEAMDRPAREHRVVYVPEGHMLVTQLASGALDAIVVYRSNVLSAAGNANRMTIVEKDPPEAIARQPFAISKTTKHRKLLERFRDMVVSPEGQGHFRERGFEWLGGK